MTALMEPPKKETVQGKWPGKVISLDDPLKRGRIQVRVPQLYGDPTLADGEILDLQLPFAEPSMPANMSFTPKVGDQVWITFQGGDPTKLVWGERVDPLADVPAKFSSSYEGDVPKTMLFQVPGGHSIELRWKSTESKIELLTGAGQQILMDAVTGQINIVTPAALNITAGGPMNVNAAGLNLTAAGGAASTTESTGTVDNKFTGNMTQVFEGTLTETFKGAKVVVAEGTLNETFEGDAVKEFQGELEETFIGDVMRTYIGLLAMTVGGVMQLTAAGLFSLTGFGIALITTGATITIGSLIGTKKRLLHEGFLLYYNAHTHAAPGSPPDVRLLATPLPPDVLETIVLTENVKAD